MKDDEIKEIYSKAMDIGYNNPRDKYYDQNEAPYALFYRGNVGIYIFLVGSKPVFLYYTGNKKYTWGVFK